MINYHDHYNAYDPIRLINDLSNLFTDKFHAIHKAMGNINPETSLSVDVNNAEQAIQLNDGTDIKLRLATPTDEVALATFLNRLSPESIFFRFLKHRNTLPQNLAWKLCTAKGPGQKTFVASHNMLGESLIIAEASLYVCYDQDAGAKISLVVEDQYQGLGLGRQFLFYILNYAHSQGISSLHAQFHYHNIKALEFIQRSPIPIQSSTDWTTGLCQIKIDLKDFSQAKGS